MNRFIVVGGPLLLLCLAISGCDAIQGIFKAGVWVGALAVIAVIALVVWLIAKLVS
jgi:hypothetical protein